MRWWPKATSPSSRPTAQDNGDQVTSYFRKNAETGKREAFQVKAEGNVRIDTGKENRDLRACVLRSHHQDRGPDRATWC